MPRLTKKKYLAVGTAGIVLASGGAAFAFFTSTGSGNGTATTGTSTDFAVTVDSIDVHDLTPGGPTDTVTFHVNNPGSGVQNLAAAVASVVDTSNAGCTAADFNISGTTITLGPLAAGGTADGTFTIQMKNRAVSQDACKGVTVNLKVDAS